MAAAYINAAISVASTIRGLSQGGKEPDRLKANEVALQAAMQGNTDALAFLKQRTGNYGVAFVTGYGEIGGWATSSAKADAQQKYQQALAAQQIKSGIGDFVSEHKDQIQEVAQETGHTILPTQWLIVGAVVLAIVILLVSRKAG